MTDEKKKKKGGGRKRGRKKARRMGGAVSITALIGIAFLLERIGLLSPVAWGFLMQGNLAGLVGVISSAVTTNFTGSGVAGTIAGGVSLALILTILKTAMRGKSIQISGRIRRITA